MGNGDKNQPQQNDGFRAAQKFVAEQLRINGFKLLPVKLIHVAGVESMPFYHKDPFDRLLISQADIEQMSIVSVDAAFDAYGAKRLWSFAKPKLSDMMRFARLTPTRCGKDGEPSGGRREKPLQLFPAESEKAFQMVLTYNSL